MFFAWGAHLPYWPVWLEGWGLEADEIGYFLGAALIARTAGTVILPAIADRYAMRRAMLATSSVLVVIVHLLHLWVVSAPVLLVLTMLAAAIMAPSVPIGEALGMRAARQHRFGYAAVRAAGSIGFMAANVGVGALIGQFGPDVALWTVVAGFLVVAGLGALHPGGGAAAVDGTDRASYREVIGLFTVPAFIVFALAHTAGQTSHSVFYVYSVLDWRAQGISDATIGWLWAIGVMAETALMLGPGRAWVARLGPANALAIAAAAAVLRWAAMAMGPDPLLLWPLQTLHALTFALGHLGTIAFLAAALPDRMLGAAQGLKTGLLGGGFNALTLFAAAAIVAHYDVSAAYWLAAVTATLAVGLAIMLRSIWTGEQLVR